MNGVSLAAAFLLAASLSSQSFTFLQAGFTQELYATSPGFMGGVAFAPDGDPWVNNCGGGGLRRFDAQTTVIVNGTSVHPQIQSLSSNVDCGMTNHPDGFMYNNRASGVTRTNATTGAPAGGPFGPNGNGLGIAPNPLTGELAYVGNNGNIFGVDANFTTSRTISTAINGSFVDGIFFDPSGTFLFCANRTAVAGSFRLSIIRYSDGTLVQNVPMTSEPDGIAFRAAVPQFVLTMNIDGTISRFDFPGNDFTLPPVQSLFASGGFRCDLSQVGSDGCLYLTQNGTRFNNGTTSGDNSIVRICPGFAPPVSNIQLTPLSATNFVGQPHTVTATVTSMGSPVVGTVVTFNVIAGPNLGVTGTAATNVAGQSVFTYTSAVIGTDTIQASFVGAGGTIVSNPVTKTWQMVIECWLFAGLAPLNVPLNLYLPFADPSDILRVDPILTIDMTLAQLPFFLVPNNPAAIGASIYTQGVLLNPGVFPQDPLKLSQAVEFQIGNGTFVHGVSNGLDLWSTSPNVVNPGQLITLAFSIL